MDLVHSRFGKGSESAAKLQSLVAAGATAEQVSTIWALEGLKIKNERKQIMSKESFEARVGEYFRQGMGRSEAILAAMKNYPDLHSEYLSRVNSGGSDMLGAALMSPMPKPKSNDFMKMVADYQREHNCNKFEAMQVIAKQYPDARAAYIRKANQR